MTQFYCWHSDFQHPRPDLIHSLIQSVHRNFCNAYLRQHECYVAINDQRLRLNAGKCLCFTRTSVQSKANKSRPRGQRSRSIWVFCYFCLHLSLVQSMSQPCRFSVLLLSGLYDEYKHNVIKQNAKSLTTTGQITKKAVCKTVITVSYNYTFQQCFSLMSRGFSKHEDRKEVYHHS